MAAHTSSFYASPLNENELDTDKYLKHAIFDQKLWEERRWCGCWFPHRALLIWMLNLVALVGHLGIAVAVVVEGAKNYEALDFQIMSIVAEWHNATADGFTYSIEPSEVGRISLTAVCGLFSGLSAIGHVAIVVSTSRRSWSKWYYRGLGRCKMWWRWLEYFFSAPLMAVALLLIGGIREVTILVLVVAGQAVTMTCGLLVEQVAVPTYENGDGEKSLYGWNLPLFSRLAPFWTGVLSMVPTWAVFVYAFYSNVAKGRERRDVQPPDWVQLIIWSEVALFTSFTFPLLWYQGQHPRNYWKTELIYSILSLASKLVLNGTLLAQVFLVGRLDFSPDDVEAS